MKAAGNTVTLSSKYQVVVPSSVRQYLKLKPGAKLMWLEVDGVAHLVPHQPASAYRGIARDLKDSEIPSDPGRF